ncbi:transglutaminase-like cysteine peptidase [Aliagarivorans taiwanensis]|uniref:transglutaminase-like cysteine peptidase n=1 Tax=Aliagarivorans taiwanensis TaxID=561966 RepID=UPI0003FA5BD2|nr:transglutaminase-like cysteine peptidase [Aliagarivorans taiwanensis]
MRIWTWLLVVVVSWPLWLVALDDELEAMATKVREFYGQRAEQRVRSWRQLVSEGLDWSEQQKLERVNAFFNQLQFLDDIDVWGQEDYWATPVEFLGANAGDCDDFSIGKYFTLRELGIDDSKMRLVYVNALEYQQFHMVVAYYATPSSEPVILDNINPTILPAGRRGDLQPIYSFNGEHLWLMKEKGRGQLAGKASRLKLWNDLRERWRLNELRKPIANFEY